MSTALKHDNYSEEKHIFTESEYLEMEKHSEEKLEFKNGQIYTMAGSSFAHGRITANLNVAFNVHLKGNSCHSLQETLKVNNQKQKKQQNQRNNDTFYYIPDIVVDCGQHTGKSEYAKEVILIVEVLSPSTRDRDLEQKFYDYQKIDTLQEYAVIEQDSMCVDIYRKKDNWTGERYLQGSDVEFISIDLKVPIEEIYADVPFERKIRHIHGLKVIH